MTFSLRSIHSQRASSNTRLALSRSESLVTTTFEHAQTYSAYTLSNAKRLVRAGVRVFDSMDGTKLEEVFAGYKFDLIVSQLPNVGSRNPLYGRNPNHMLVRRFLKSAGGLLKQYSKVAITTINSPHYDGASDADGAAHFAGYEKPTSYPFVPSDYRDYQYTNTLDDSSSAIAEISDFATLIFKSKCHGG